MKRWVMVTAIVTMAALSTYSRRGDAQATISPLYSQSPLMDNATSTSVQNKAVILSAPTGTDTPLLSEIYVADNATGTSCVMLNMPGVSQGCFPNWQDYFQIFNSSYDFKQSPGAPVAWAGIQSDVFNTFGITYAVSVDVKFLASPEENLFYMLTDPDNSNKYLLSRDHFGNWGFQKKFDGPVNTSNVFDSGVFWDPISDASTANAPKWTAGTILWDTLYMTFMPNGQLKLDEVVLYLNNTWKWTQSLMNYGYPVTGFNSGGLNTPPTAAPLFDSGNDFIIFAIGDPGSTATQAWTRRQALFSPALANQDIATDSNLIVARLGIHAPFSSNWLPCNTGQFQANASDDTPPTLTSQYTPTSMNTPCNPAASLSTTDLSFSTQASPQPYESPDKAITVTNTGGSSLSIASITIGGDNPGDFSVDSDSCSGKTLAPGASCMLQVGYTDYDQRASATLQVTTNAAISAPVVTLAGQNG